jgi:hypothetical protein
LVDKLNSHEQVAIWLRTDARFDWLWRATENTKKEGVSMPIGSKEEHAPVNIDDGR